jgi:predicted dehydrogenase
MMKNKRTAIIGFGGMGQRHLSACRKIGLEVTAICDWQSEKIREIVPDISEKHIYSDYNDLLANEEVDIVSVVTNGPTHADISIAASEAGVPNILCEKPLATSIRKARQVVDVCSENGTRLAVNHIRRWSPTYNHLKRMINDGVIGDLRHIYFSCGNTGLGNFAIHFFDTARFLTGSEPAWAVGFIDRSGTPNPRGVQFADPGGYGIIVFENGARMYVDTSEDTGVQYSFQLVGTYGRIIIDELNGSWQIRARNTPSRAIPLTRYGTDMEIVPFESEVPFDIVDLTSRALAELATGKEISSPGSEGVRSLEMVMALHLSDETGNTRISFPLDGPEQEKEIRIA